MEKEIIKDIITDKGESVFDVRIIRNEGAGLLTTNSGDSYLILDSLDYWYDLIQDGYPAKQKCKCKNDHFSVKFAYTYREHYNDIRHINVFTTCTQCGKKKEVCSIDIDYSPTSQLMDTPLTFCPKPKIKYKLTQITGYWNNNEVDNLLRFASDELHLNIYAWFFNYNRQLRYFEKLTPERAMQQVKQHFLNLFITPMELDMDRCILTTNNKGVFLKNDLWRKDEIIEISHLNMYDIGTLYYMEFANEYLDKGEVKGKSEEFQNITSRLMEWLKENYITQRGKNCFDGEEGYAKYIKKQSV
ncbi:hypothetical protein [Bacteroides sp. 519]|uniref:hypothetical protein n=1 Tax=Bacteroides sp. 519 TaxID=2302937 RepID=UPI0013CF73E2|nr:hypothetical protein [Bacteroides sp. 519]NDV60023.1 hypothetical protein [Bacteroides sp. 519]